MTIHTTRKELLRNYGNKGLAVGYCDAWHLLRGENKIASTSGVCGWNFDAYDICGVLITTGYRSLIGKRPEHLRKYEEKARKISDDWNIPFERKQKRIHALLLKWIQKEYEKKGA